MSGVGRARPWWLAPIAIAVVCVAAGGFLARRQVLGFYHDRRLHAATTSEAAKAATRGVLEYGSGAALDRLARLLAREQRSPVGLGAWMGIHDVPAARALVPRLLAAAGRAAETAERGFALEVVASIVRESVTEPVFIHDSGRMFFFYRANGGAAAGGYTSSIDQHPPREAVFAWADWLVAHGYVAPGDPALRELGERPAPAAAKGPRLGLEFDYGLDVVSVTPTGTAATIGAKPGDVIRTIGDAAKSVSRLVYTDDDLAKWVAEAREQGARALSIGIERAGVDEKLTFDLPPGDDLGVRGRRRLKVSLVIPGMPGAAAGIVPGDVLRAIDGAPVASVEEIVNVLRGKTSVEALVERAGVGRTVTVDCRMK